MKRVPLEKVQKNMNEYSYELWANHSFFVDTYIIEATNAKEALRLAKEQYTLFHSKQIRNLRKA